MALFNKTGLVAILCTLACGGQVDDEQELDTVPQDTVAACLRENSLPQYGVQNTQAPWTRCDPNVNMACLLPGVKQAYEIAMTNNGSTWSQFDKLEWNVGGTNVANFMWNSFTAWQGLSLRRHRFNQNTFDTEIPGIETATDLGFYLPNYLELRKQTFADPSWWPNRATTTNAPLTDLAKLQCAASIPLTDNTTASWARCTKWVAKIDYDRMRAWATARGTSIQPMIESVLKKLNMWAVGLGPGNGSGLTVTDPKVYTSGSNQNPTTFANTSIGSEQSWVNNYQVTGEGTNTTIDNCISACVFDVTCKENCRRRLECTLE